MFAEEMKNRDVILKELKKRQRIHKKHYKGSHQGWKNQEKEEEESEKDEDDDDDEYVGSSAVFFFLSIKHLTPLYTTHSF